MNVVCVYVQSHAVQTCMVISQLLLKYLAYLAAVSIIVEQFDSQLWATTIKFAYVTQEAMR